MRRRIACWAVVIGCFVLTCTIDGRAQTTTQDAAYATLALSHFNELFEANPSQASDAGIHQYDRELDDLSPAHFASQIASDKTSLAKLNAIDPQTLSSEVQIDRQMLIYALKDDLLAMQTEGEWQHNPDLYTQIASDAIYQIMARDYAPLSTRIQYAIARESQVPRLLKQAQNNTTTVDAATAQVSYEDALGAIDFFAQDVPEGFSGVKDQALQRQFKSANAATIQALRAYVQWIKTGPLAHPKGTFAIGRAAYQQRLLYVDAITMPVDQYLALGKRELAATQAQFNAVARTIDPKHSPEQVYASLSLAHPTAQALLPTAQQDIIKLRAFVKQRHIITLPANANIRVVETPAYSRATTFAAFDSPGPLEKVATQTHYYVTPPDTSWPRAVQEKALGFFNDYTFPIISAHEIMPGHFVNYAIDKQLDLSLTRKMLWSPEFGEGWAHYDEQMVVDEGWGNGDPKVRLAQLNAALIRECRYVVGVAEHTQGMTVDQATVFLMKNAHLSQTDARREALRGTQDPMYGYYTLGKLMILKLRADYQKKLGGAYTLEAFHDALLAHGDPPIPLLRPILLGDADDGKPL
jgi:uncharacterized protein (DUF885 family)